MSIYTFMSFIDFLREKGLENEIKNMPITKFKRELDDWKQTYDKR